MTEIEVVKGASCPSLSGKSTLGYELGRDVAGKAQLRIVSNTGGGMFSDSWVPWEDVAELLHAQGDKPVTSHSLHPLCKGKSVNTAGFVLAVLLHEGVVGGRPDGKGRGYSLVNIAAVADALGGGAEASAEPKTKAKGRVQKKKAA